MKKLILGIAATALIASATIVYANSTAKNHDDCTKKSECVKCPCTPDCQPGDPNCTCKKSCEK